MVLYWDFRRATDNAWASTDSFHHSHALWMSVTKFDLEVGPELEYNRHQEFYTISLHQKNSKTDLHVLNIKMFRKVKTYLTKMLHLRMLAIQHTLNQWRIQL